MTTHSFNVSVAERFGVEKAILLQNISFWLDKNLANERHIHNGMVWTYNSREAFSKLFPYWSAQKIGRMLRELEESGVITSENFNAAGYDRTKWYTINADKYHVQNETIHCSELNNGLFDSEQPIPDIKPDSNTDDIEEVIRYEKIMELFNRILGKHISPIRSVTGQRKKHIRARVSEDKKRQSLDWWEHYFYAVEQMPFLIGQGMPNPAAGRQWSCDFDWLINETNMVKVLEGKYDGR